MCEEHHPHEAVHEVAPRRLPDREIEQIPLEAVDSVTITTLLDNTSDALLLDRGPARRAGITSPVGEIPRVRDVLMVGGETIDPLHAEHGFSALVTVRKGDRAHHVLFDAGMSPDGMVTNMRRLGVDPAAVEVIVLSHGHFDHTTGLDGFVRAVKQPNVPVVIHPEFWSRRRIAVPGRDPFELPTTSKRGLLDAGFDIVERETPSFLFEDSVLVTGEVDRTTAFEQGMPFHEAFRDGRWAADPLILDDQALLVNVRGLGLVVLTGCGHAGVVNIARHAQRLTGIEHVHLLMGGFHLNGPLFEPVIAPTVDALAELAPDYVVPAHCTGWRAAHAVEARLPDAFIQNSVGTRYELAAPAA